MSVSNASRQVHSQKIGVVLANTGSPAGFDPESVRAYLSEFLMDPRIAPMNSRAWSFILDHFILPTRSKRSGAAYARIWTENGSPLVAYHQSLACMLQRRLSGDLGKQIEVRSAMNYGAASIGDAIRSLADAGCDKVIAIPTYPQSAFSTTSSVCDAVEVAERELATSASTATPHGDGESKVHVVREYHDNRLYIRSISDAVSDAGFGQRKDDRLLMLFHSVPMKDIAAGDTYAVQVGESTRAIADDLALEPEEWSVAFQSRFDRSRKWLSPSAKDAVDKIAVPGRLFVVCPGFSADCLETLVSVDEGLRGYFARQHPGREMVYVPCLNDSQRAVDIFENLVESLL